MDTNSNIFPRRDRRQGSPLILAITLMLSLILSMLSPSQNLLAQDDGCWNIFRGNQALEGVVDADISLPLGILWTFRTDAEIKSSPVVCGEHVVIGSTNGFVYCLDVSGNLIWKVNTGNAIEAGALILDGIVYIGNLDGSLFAFDLKTGEKRWEYKTENQISGSANWIKIGDKNFLFVGSYDYYLHCVNAATGKGVWKYESDNFINGAAALYEGNAVFGGCDGYLHIVDLEEGMLKDKIDLATYIAGSAAISNNHAFIGDYDGSFRCVDLVQKKISWEWAEEDSFLPFIASPAVSGNRVVTGNENKYIYCFNKKNGELNWKMNTRSRVHSSPVIAGRKVIAANMRGDIFLLDLATGNVLQEYELGSPVSSNPAISGGKVFLGAADGMVYCLGKK